MAPEPPTDDAVASASEAAAAKPRPTPVQRTKFDRWLFDCGIDNVAAGKLFGAHPITIGLYRKRFDDPARQVPKADFILDVERLSGGVVRFEDWHRPCEVAYLSPGRTAEAPTGAAR